MQIIQPGRPQQGWAKEYTCTGKGNNGGGCGAILLVEQPDLFHTSHHSYGDTFPEYYITFQCPSCKVLTDIPDSPVRAKELPHFNDWQKKLVK